MNCSLRAVAAFRPAHGIPYDIGRARGRGLVRAGAGPGLIRMHTGQGLVRGTRGRDRAKRPTRVRRLTERGFKRAATEKVGTGQAPHPGAAPHGVEVRTGSDGRGRAGAKHLTRARRPTE
ncbi:hypothetical protein GCM10009605_06200 [Nocardiopsis composta]